MGGVDGGVSFTGSAIAVMLHHTTTMRYKMKDGTAQDQQDQWAQFQHLSPSGWKVDAKWDLETELRETHSDTYPEIPNDLPVDEQRIARSKLFQKQSVLRRVKKRLRAEGIIPENSTGKVSSKRSGRKGRSKRKGRDGR